MPDGSQHAGHTDAYEQIVPINEQIAWTHVFSDGIERDSGDVLLELMEFAIQWRQANDLPTSAFVEVNGAVVPRKRPAEGARQEGRQEGGRQESARALGARLMTEFGDLLADTVAGCVASGTRG